LQVNHRELFEEREDGHAVHHGGFEEESLALLCGQVAQFAVGVDDGAFVGGDGVGPVFEGGADVGDCGLAIFNVQRCGFEEDVGLGCRKPVADVAGRADANLWGGFRLFAGGGARATYACATYFAYVESLGIRDPAQAAGGYASDAVGDAVARAEFLCAVCEEADESPVDVAEAEEAEVVGADENLLERVQLSGCAGETPRYSRRDAGATLI
jgi:hypothetical protein